MMPHDSLSESNSMLNKETEYNPNENDYDLYKIFELTKVNLAEENNDKPRLSSKLCFREVTNDTESNNSTHSNDQDAAASAAASSSVSTTRYVSIENGTDITELVEQQCRYYINSTRKHNITFTTECGPILLGRVSTSVAFALSAIFSVCVFCAVNY